MEMIRVEKKSDSRHILKGEGFLGFSNGLNGYMEVRSHSFIFIPLSLSYISNLCVYCSLKTLYL